jgi:hypothetical protein
MVTSIVTTFCIIFFVVVVIINPIYMMISIAITDYKQKQNKGDKQ